MVSDKTLARWTKYSVDTDFASFARELLAARKVIEAARGLSHSTDWNNGTHAKLHGYRQKLLDAIAEYDAAVKE